MAETGTPNSRNQVSGVDGTADSRVCEASLEDSLNAPSNANDGHVDDEASLRDEDSPVVARHLQSAAAVPLLGYLTAEAEQVLKTKKGNDVEETGAASVNEAAAIAPPAQMTTEGRAPSAANKRKQRLCTVNECTKYVQKGGLCRKHGAPVKQKMCSVDECTKVVKRGGLCCSHYREEHGAPVKQKMCSVDECTKAAKKGGLCRKHYREEHGAPVKQKMCSVDECTKAVQKGGLCCSHYREEYGVPVNQNMCSVDECIKAVQNGGLCCSHYSEKHGGHARQCCSVDECTKRVALGGMCNKHYSKVHGKPAKRRKVE